VQCSPYPEQNKKPRLTPGPWCLDDGASDRVNLLDGVGDLAGGDGLAALR